MTHKTSVYFQRRAWEEGHVVVDISDLQEHIGKPCESCSSFVSGQNEESPGWALLAVQALLCKDLSGVFVDGKLATGALAVEGVAQSVLVSLLVWIFGRNLQDKLKDQDRATKTFCLEIKTQTSLQFSLVTLVSLCQQFS